MGKASDSHRGKASWVVGDGRDAYTGSTRSVASFCDSWLVRWILQDPYFLSHFMVKWLIACFFIAFRLNYTTIIFSSSLGIKNIWFGWILNEMYLLTKDYLATTPSSVGTDPRRHNIPNQSHASRVFKHQIERVSPRVNLLFRGINLIFTGIKPPFQCQCGVSRWGALLCCHSPTD